jgi:hypothetical protein
MAQDIKKMFQDHKPDPEKLPEGHEARFEAKLHKAFLEGNSEKPKTSMPWLKIAAVAVLVFGLSYFGYKQLSGSSSEIQKNPSEMVVDANPGNNANPDSKKITLADVSPDLKKIEEFYMTGINVQLASLKITEENKDLVDGYMGQLADLDREYAVLNSELNKVGPKESTITALIDNLKLRLDLLFKLKNKLKELKNQNNDDFKIIQT